MSDERFFFVHVQKTAGTELFRRMRLHFGTKAVYPDDSDGTLPDPILLTEMLVDRWRTRGNEIKVVTGHFPLCVADILGGGFTTLTVLREPVDRTMSFLRHFHQLFPATRSSTFEELYADPLRFHGLIQNHMVKMFSLTPEEMDHGAMSMVEFSPERLERAKEQLATVDVIGIQERFEDFYDELVVRFGFAVTERLNANSTNPADFSESFLERIAEDNALDIEFYEYAKELVTQRSLATEP